jgi:hypothetical protein
MIPVSSSEREGSTGQARDISIKESETVGCRSSKREDSTGQARGISIKESRTVGCQ